MTNSENIESNLRAIRTVVDTDVTGCEIESVVEQGKKLSSMIGLSAECKASAKKIVETARLKAIMKLQEQKLQPSILLKMADAEIGDQLALYEYADRLNASITHQLDYYRTVISLYKSELENSLK